MKNDSYKLIWEMLPKSNKNEIYFIILIIILCSLSEMASLGLMVQFLDLITNKDAIKKYDFMGEIIGRVGIIENSLMIIIASVLFILVTALTGALRVLLIWKQMRLSMAIGAYFGKKAFSNTLNQDYLSHTYSNSSEVLAGTFKAYNLVHHIIIPSVTIITGIILSSAIISMLLMINVTVTIIVTVGFIIVYFPVMLITKKIAEKNSIVVAVAQTKTTQVIQEALGGIRDVIIDNSQKFHKKNFDSSMDAMQRALADNQILANSPKYIIEALGTILIILTISKISINQTNSNLIPFMGALAMASQKLLPLMHQIYHGYMQINGNKQSVLESIKLLKDRNNLKSEKESLILFDSKIRIDDVTFRYPGKSNCVVNNFNMEIMKGEIVGIIGSTGSGKSTIMDIMLGLISPVDGRVLIDNLSLDANNIKSWRSCISHVPQNIYLMDGTIAENIAFNIDNPSIDMNRVIKAAEAAEIAETIQQWEDGYKTRVGERGVQLSGGQRQRIGIARAIYKNSHVIFMDESTSALDAETEEKVLKNIIKIKEKITIIMITHRLSTLRFCNAIYEVKDNSLNSVNYKDIESK